MLSENGGSRYLRKVTHNLEYHNLNVYHLETFKVHGLRMFEEKMLKNGENVTRGWKKLYNFTVRIFRQMLLGW
jgi:hypothetical protein